MTQRREVPVSAGKLTADWSVLRVKASRGAAGVAAGELTPAWRRDACWSAAVAHDREFEHDTAVSVGKGSAPRRRCRLPAPFLELQPAAAP